MILLQSSMLKLNESFFTFEIYIELLNFLSLCSITLQTTLATWPFVFKFFLTARRKSRGRRRWELWTRTGSPPWRTTRKRRPGSRTRNTTRSARWAGNSRRESSSLVKFVFFVTFHLFLTVKMKTCQMLKKI